MLAEADPDLVDIATETGGRYMGTDRAAEYGAPVQGEQSLHVSMERLHAAPGVTH